jgi:hypothetical protein
MDRIPFISLDIETIPRPDLPPECMPQFEEASVSLGNLKDPAKIREKIDQARAKFNLTLDKKLSTDPDLLMICAFCGYDSATNAFTELFAKNLKEEGVLLEHAWAFIIDAIREEHTLVTFNGRSFDVPALYRRAMLQDVRVPHGLYQRIAGRTAIDRMHLDLMLALGTPTPFSSRPEIHNFDYYLKLFGLEGKAPGWDGSKVYPAFKEHWFEDIQIYCRSDVEALNALFRRVQPWILDQVTELGSDKRKAMDKAA